jgi:restriction system protein
MAVPTYDQFIEPILRYLASHSDGAAARDVHTAAADALGLDALQRQEVLPSGVQAVYKNRAGWAHDRLKRAGLSSSVRRGYWKLTADGFAFVAQHSAPLSAADLEELTTVNTDVRLTSHDSAVEQAVQALDVPAAATASPDDRLEAALAELRHTVRAELLETLAEVSPAFFETIVLDVLHRMGYGTSRADLQQVGGPGDAGIDGIISLDRLGLEKVYVQAKKWQNVVGRPEFKHSMGLWPVSGRTRVCS